MSDAASRETSSQVSKRNWRLKLLRIWLSCALPWLITVAAISIYDHHRAISRTALSHWANSAMTSHEAKAVDRPNNDGGHVTELAFRWLHAVARYSGPTITFYGILPVGLTFALYVLFLPWADRWAQQGSLED